MADATHSIVIRPAATADLDAILALNRATYKDHEQRLPDWFPTNNTDGMEQVIRHAVAWEGPPAAYPFGILVAELAGVMAGHVIFHCATHLAGEGPLDWFGTIWDISLVPEARGKGIAGQLVDAAVNAMRERGCTAVLAQVWQGNVSSAALFDRIGFVPAATEYRLRLSPRVQGLRVVKGGRARPWWHRFRGEAAVICLLAVLWLFMRLL